jgi:peptide/nickel transport system permease protein
MRTSIRARAPRSLQRFLDNRAATAGLAVLASLVVVAVAAPLVSPHDSNAIDMLRRAEGPSATYWLGSDSFGRDILSRLIDAVQVAFQAVPVGLATAMGIGIPAGMAAGFFGRSADAVLSRVMDGVLAFPPLLLALGIIGMLGPGLTNAMFAVGFVISPRFFRIARAAAQGAARQTYVEAARADGSPPGRLLLRHIVPNAAPPVIVEATVALAILISAEASLSFIGLGVRLPQASLGGMARDAFNTIHDAGAWPLVPPTVLLVVLVLSASLVGDGLRDALGRDRRGA